MSNISSLRPFQKGDDPRRNKNGRPKGSVNSKVLTKKVLKSLNEIIGKDNDGHTIRKIDALAEVIIMKAIKGNPGAIKLLWDRLEGKAKTSGQIAREQGEARPADIQDSEIERLVNLFPGNNDKQYKDSTKS